MPGFLSFILSSLQLSLIYLPLEKRGPVAPDPFILTKRERKK